MKRTFQVSNFMRNMLFLLIFLSFLPANLASISLPIAELSLYRIFVLIVLCVLILKIYRQRNRLFIPKIISSSGFLVLFFWGWCIYSLLNIGFIQDSSLYIRANYFLISGTVMITVLYFLGSTEGFIDKALKIYLFVSIVHTLIGLMEVYFNIYLYADLNYLDPYNIFDYSLLYRVPVSFFGNPNDFANFLLLSSMIYLYYFLKVKKNLLKIGLALLLLGSTYLIVKTGSRANLIGLFTMFVLFIVSQIKLRKSNLVLVILISLTLIIIFGLNVNVVIQIISGTVNNSGSNLVRLNLIRNGMIFLRKSSFIGVGAGNIEYYMEHFSVHNVHGVYNIHNWWMEILVGYGIIIFLLYLSFYISQLILLFNILFTNKCRDKKSLSKMLIVYNFVFLASSISSSSLISTEWIWVWWGIQIAFISSEMKKKKAV